MTPAYDPARLARLLRNEADPGNRRRIVTVLEYLDLQPGDTVLDCGCGLGWFLRVAGELYEGCDLYGIDPDVERLSRAAREVTPQTRLLVAAGGQLPFTDDTFDKVALSEVIEHVDDDAGVLREVWRVLKPGGVVAVTVPNQRYPFLWDPVNWSRERLGLAPIRSGVFGGIWTNHLRLYDERALVSVVERQRLAVDETRSLVRHCIPFAHNLVYGLGKPLVESGVLPAADRFRFDDNSGSLLNPLNWALGVINAIDRLDGPGPRPGSPSVCLALKAHKPAMPAARGERAGP